MIMMVALVVVVPSDCCLKARAYIDSPSYAVYPDGTRARIISGSGSVNTNGSGVSFALVGSQLDNGDVIVSTPQDCALLCQLDNSPAMPADFLSPEAL